MESALKGEAWDSLKAEIKADKDYYSYTRDLILQMMERHLEEAKKKADEYRKKQLEKGDIIEDGFGASASAICSICGCRAVYVCRPGDIRCGVCYDGNTKEYYTGAKCDDCGMMAVHNDKCVCCLT